MKMPRIIPILASVIVSTISVQASDTIMIEMSRSRNMNAVNLESKAEQYMGKGDYENARKCLDTAIQADATYWPAFYMRAQLFAAMHKYDLVIKDCNEVLRQYPYLGEAQLLRGRAYAGLKNYALCRKELDRVIDMHPHTDTLARAVNQRAWFLATCPDKSFCDPKQAIRDGELGCKLTNWQGSDWIDTLAVAYASAGDFENAVRCEQKAIALETPGSKDAQELQQHLARFSKRQSL